MRCTLIPVVLIAFSSQAADPAVERLEPVMAARLDLQRNLRTELETTLTSIVAPHRVQVRVEATLQARLAENTRTEEVPGTEILIKPMRQADLPGLPVVRQQVVGVGTPQMEYRVPGRKTVERTSIIDAEVTRLSVKVLLDDAVPEEVRAEVKRFVVAFTGLDVARGDVLELASLPPAAMAGLDRLPPMWLYSLVTLVGALLLALLFALGLGLGRRSGATAGSGAGFSDGIVRLGDNRSLDPGAQLTGTAVGSAMASGPFAGLAGCSANELTAIIGELPDADASVLLAALSQDQAAVQRVFGKLPLPRQLALGQWMVTSHTINLSEVERVAEVAVGALAKVRSVVSLGGPDQLASLVAEAPEEVLKQLFEALAASDAAAAAQLRQRMPFFDDLEQLEAPAIRAVVTQLDPALLALALGSAKPALRERVYQSVSRRLRAILESEAEGLKPDPEQAQAARRRVEVVMRRAGVAKRPPQPTATA